MVIWAAWAAMAGAQPTTEVRFAGGGQFESESHGILDAGIRRGPWQLQWLTDTLDARVSPQLQRGRVEVGVRLATFAAGMWITPYAGGSVDRCGPSSGWRITS
ncbi:MAG: hypothetical protein KTR31_04810 [Myxococcales bacterium]|nr:hypothetical protein [Myxococcales bacterium]